MSVVLTTNRHRTQSKVHSAGTAVWSPGGLGNSSSSSTENTVCDDVLGNPTGDNPFVLTRSHNALWWLYGNSFGSNGGWEYNGYVRTGILNHLAGGKPEASFNTWLTSALAATNPSKSTFDLPVFLFELRKVPEALATLTKRLRREHGTIRNYGGESPITEMADVFLGIEYGLKPFIRDIRRMMDFHNSVERKLKLMRELQQSEGKGKSRSATVHDDFVVSGLQYSYATGLYSENNWIEYQTSTHRKRWVSTKWYPTEDYSSWSDAEKTRRANLAVAGLDFSLSNLWEAMPWSWLIDWFSNVGDIYQGQRNTIPTSQSGSCIMGSAITGVRNARRVSGGGGNTIGITPNRFHREEKLRFPQILPPKVEFYLPLLDGRQLSILGAIGITRFLGDLEIDFQNLR